MMLEKYQPQNRSQAFREFISKRGKVVIIAIDYTNSLAAKLKKKVQKPRPLHWTKCRYMDWERDCASGAQTVRAHPIQTETNRGAGRRNIT
jgi:hypothetical protein